MPRLGRIEGDISAAAVRSRNLKFGAWVMLAALLIGLWFLARRWAAAGFDVHSFLLSLSQADSRWLLAAWALCIFSFYGRVLRWMVMLRPIAPGARTADVFAATAIGFSAVAIFGRPGELVRPYLIARVAGVQFLTQIAAWFLERIYDTLAVLAIFGYALAVVPPSGTLSAALQWVLRTGGWFTGVSCSLCLAVLVALHLYSESVESRLIDALGFLRQHHHEKAARIIRAVMDGLRSTRCPRAILLLFAYSVFEWTIIASIFYAMFQAFPQTVGLSLPSILVYLGFISFGSIIQIPGIGGGVQIVSVLVLTEFFHINLEAAAGIAIVTWFFTLVGILPVGFACAVQQGLSWRNIKEMEKEAAL
jgi:glycosyltransferase 2 family protein